VELYKALDRAGVVRLSMAENHPEGRHLGEPKATKDLLEFLANTGHMVILSRLRGMPEGMMNGAYRPWKRPARPA
jgi:hypothetical protein